MASTNLMFHRTGVEPKKYAAAFMKSMGACLASKKRPDGYCSYNPSEAPEMEAVDFARHLELQQASFKASKTLEVVEEDEEEEEEGSRPHRLKSSGIWAFGRQRPS